MNIKTVIGIAALTISSLSLAQEATPAAALPMLESRSRAEVLAELSLWRQAGLDRYNYEGADLTGVEYQRRMAQYSRLRSGPQYAAELQRIQAGQVTHAAIPSNRGG